MINARTSYQLMKKPSDGALRAIADEFKLGPGAGVILEQTVLDALSVLAVYRDTPNAQPARSLRIKRLKNLDRYLRQLRSELGRAKNDLGVILPFETRALLGESFTFSALQQFLGSAVRTTNTDMMIATLFRGPRKKSAKPPTIGDLEEHGRGARQALGLTHAGELLINYLAAIHAPIIRWLELERLGRGGRPAQLERQYLVLRLAETCPQILGRPAPVAVTGKFVNLCIEVFRACGLASDGVEKLVPKIVKALREKKAEG
jgi:hypothetical protein